MALHAFASILLGRRHFYRLSTALGKDRINSLLRFPLIWILVCCYPFLAFGCSKHPVLFQKDGPGKKVYREASPSELSDYIRTVFKISTGNTQSAKALNELHQRRPTLEELSRHIADNPEDLESRRSLAAHYLRERLYHNAFQLYQEIRSIGLEDATVERGLARIWNEWGNYSLAKRHATRAFVLDPESAETLEWLGKIHLRGNEPQAAVSAFLAALSLMPENPSLLSNIGSAFLKLGNWTKARDYLERTLVLDPTLIEARSNLGKALAHLGDYQGALHEFGAENNPTAALNKLGIVYLAEQKWEEAQKAFQQALVLAPDYAKARLNLSIAQSYLPPVTIVNLPPLEVVGSLAQTAGVKSKGMNALQNEDKRTTLNADAKKMSVEHVPGDLQNLDLPYLNTQLGFSAVSPHRPTPTIVYLPSFEESGWKSYRPDLIPASKVAHPISTVTQTIPSESVGRETLESKVQAPSPLDRTGSPDLRDAESSLLPLRMDDLSHLKAERYEVKDSKFGVKNEEEQPVLALKSTFRSPKRSSRLDNSKIQTISPPSTTVEKHKKQIDELWEDKVLIELPVVPKHSVEIRIGPKRNLIDHANKHEPFPDILISTDEVLEALPEIPSELYQPLWVNLPRLRNEEATNHPNRAGNDQELPKPDAWKLDLEQTQEGAKIDTEIALGPSPLEAFSERNLVATLPFDAHRGLPLTYGFERVRLPARVQSFRENSLGNLKDVLVEYSAQSKSQTNSGSEGVVPSPAQHIGESDTGVPGSVLATPAQISGLAQSPYLDPAVLGSGSNMRDLLITPIPPGKDGRISKNSLSPFVDPFGLRERFHDFIISLWEPLHYSKHPPENSFPLEPKDGVEDPLIARLSAIGLGVVFCFSFGIGIAFHSLNTSMICLRLGARQQRRRSTPVFLQPSRHQSPENPFLLPSVRLEHEIAEELRVISKIRALTVPTIRMA